ncbi:MAG TPA: methyltransferase, partial [Lautropia sp.]|nr:methyltransferase [Lautropia sp.]
GLTLFDLPAVAEQARQRFAREGIADRATAIGGSFLHDPLPGGADLVTLVRVIHDHDDAEALAILERVHSALVPGGSLLLAEPMAGTPGAEPVGAYFGFYLLAMGSGRPRTASELTALLHEAGFVHVRQLSTRMPLQSGALVARRDA